MAELTIYVLVHPHKSMKQRFPQYSWHTPAGIEVCVTGSTSGISHTRRTDSNGAACIEVTGDQYTLTLPDLPGFTPETNNFTVAQGQQTHTEEIHVYPADQNDWLVPLQLMAKPIGQPTAFPVTGANVQLSGRGGKPLGNFTSMAGGNVYGAWPAGEVTVKPGKAANLTPVPPEFMTSSGQAQDWIPVQYKPIPARISIRPELRPFGVEAQRVLRLEKGHFIVGQDTDGLTDPLEANAMWAVAMKKPFFIGQRSLRILQARGPRQKLVGIELAKTAPLPKECHLVIDNGAIAGRVTSVTHSRVLNKSIGLAMLSPDLAQVGRDIQIRIDNGALLAARVAQAPFYDPKNLRQKAEPGA